MKEYIIVNCPHCNQLIMTYLKEFNCKIFRHGIFKNNYKQIDPHLPKKECDRLFSEKLIYGCGKPYKIIKNEEKWIAVKCDYI
jgi:hypothetical protein